MGNGGPSRGHIENGGFKPFKREKHRLKKIKTRQNCKKKNWRVS